MESEGWMSIWLCNGISEKELHDYVQFDYMKMESGEIQFRLGRDFGIDWCDEDFIEISSACGRTGRELLEGHSYIESVLPALEKSRRDALDGKYDGAIVICNLKYDGRVREAREKQGRITFIGSFEYCAD